MSQAAPPPAAEVEFIRLGPTLKTARTRASRSLGGRERNNEIARGANFFTGSSER